MLLNILHPALNSAIICSTVATENYEPSNLISADVQKSRMGFMAYSCVKPPVDLDFKFQNPFDVQYISIWPSVASQKSVGFQILSENAGSQSIVGNGFITNEPGILFYRGDVYSKCKVEHIPSAQTFYRATLRNTDRILSDCTNITVRIVKTANSSVPAICKIEIWGYVSKMCAPDLIADIHNVWCKETSMRMEAIAESKPCNKIEEEKCDSESIGVESDKMEIPEEFLDIITCEIMSIPLVLPSGNVIDQHTLDKHAQQEAVWGRPPSDPFTGQPFTKYRKPFVSFVLKGRIEKFLTDNSEKQELFNVPRVTGYFAPDRKKMPNVLYNQNKEKNMNNSDNNKNMNLEQGVDITLKSDCGRLELTQKYKSDFPYDKEYRNTKVKFKKIDRSSLIIRACFECNVNERLLKIVCGHFICRTCITKAKTLKCKYCEKEFSKMDVQNYIA